MKFFTLSIFAFLLVLSCNQKTLRRHKELPTTKKTLVVKINFYRFDSAFLAYFPDTAIKQFKTLKELNNYILKKEDDFFNYCKKEKLKNNNQSLSLSVRSAQLQFYYWINILCLRQLWKLPRNGLSMITLSAYSMSKDDNYWKETIALFNSFPQTIKKSIAGKKAWARITEEKLNRNKRFDMNEFDSLKVIDNNGKNVPFSESIHGPYKYYILVYGASWCFPCRVDEKQLKLWLPQIDTSRIKIVGFSIDTKPEEWRKYLQQEAFPWKSYLLKGGWNNEVLKTLDFNTVPMNSLIDNTGKIMVQNSDIRRVLLYLSKLN